jgi:hypothetical protein
MEQPILSFEETLSLIDDDIRLMASAAQSFDDLAEQMPDGDEKRHLQFLAARYHECEEARRTLIEKIRRQTHASS